VVPLVFKTSLGVVRPPEGSTPSLLRHFGTGAHTRTSSGREPRRPLQLALIPGHHIRNDDFFRRNQRARTVIPANIDQLSALAFEFIDDGSFGCRSDRAVDIENFTSCAAANSFKADIYHNRAPLNSKKTGFSSRKEL